MKALTGDDPAALGHYTLLARLGAGGMGVVYLGRSPAGRLVAIKVVRDEYAADPAYRSRFAREARSAQRVSGYFSAAVIEAEPGARTPWLAQEYVPGPSLQATVREQGPLPPRTLVRLALGLAEAVRSIHAAGLVHRDLKPGNVLLAEDGPRVIDFGLARSVLPDGHTRTGSLMGTPGYMSPEQARGEEVGFASDVFSLGGVLAYAATGRRPFGEGAPAAVLHRIATAEPDLAGIAEPFRGLIAACLAKDPAARPTAEALISRVTELGGQDPDWLPEGVRRGVDAARREQENLLRQGRPLRERRRRWPLAAGAAAAALVLVAGGVAAARLLPAGGGGSAGAGAGEAPPSAGSPAGDPAEAPEGLPRTELTGDDLGEPDLLLSDPGGRVLSEAAFKPDGSRLSVGGPAVLQTWLVGEERLAADTVLPDGQGTQAFGYSPDPQGPIEAYAAVGLLDSGRIELISEKEDGWYLQAAPDGTTVADVEFSAQGDRLLGLDAGCRLTVWAMDPGEKTADAWISKANPTVWPQASWHPDGDYIIGTCGGRPAILAPENGEVVETVPTRDTPRDAVFSPDGSTIAVVGDNHVVELWNADTLERYAALSGAEGPIMKAAYNGDGSVLATLGVSEPDEDQASEELTADLGTVFDETVRLWSPADQEQIGVLDADNGSVPLGLAFGPDDAVAVTYENGDVAVWNLG